MKKKFPPVTGVLFAVAGIVMAAVGLYRGETDTVFIKAIRICLECIGIG